MNTRTNEKVVMALYESPSGTGKNVQFQLHKDANESELGIVLAGIINFAENNDIDFDEVVKVALEILDSEEEMVPMRGNKVKMMN